MSLQDRLTHLFKIVKWSSIVGGSGFFVGYHVRKTYKAVNSIVNPEVLDREKKHKPEYIYVEDPPSTEHKKETKHLLGLSRIWKSFKHSLSWKLLWLCKHGSKEQRDVALEQFAAFKRNKIWDCWKLAQALDKDTAVLLARTKGADLRYFLPPPIHVRRAALTTQQLLSFKLRDFIRLAQSTNPHSCIKHFLSKYFANVQEQAMDSDAIPSKPDSISETDLCMLCLDAIYHHISLFNVSNYAEDTSCSALVNAGLLGVLSEAMLRNPNNREFDLAVLRVLTVLSVHSELLETFFQNGLIGELARLLRSPDVRLASSAAVCLANLSGEHCYRPGLYLLHPLYRTTTPPSCDTLLVHGLRGGVFVTWRQRDKKCAEPVGLLEVTVANIDCDPCEEKTPSPENNPFLDIELQQVMKDLMEIDDEALLSDWEVVLHDIPIETLRESYTYKSYMAVEKRIALIQEQQDKCNHTYCWPRDWLPKDCHNLRILGINYWSSLSEWLERCPLQNADIETRALDMVPALIDAKVGRNNTPIVWLAHSMGGLIVKQVLVEASQSNQQSLKKISDNTKAVFFYSTPHKGSALASLPRAAAAVLWPSNDVRQLQENSPSLLVLHQAFIQFAEAYNWETISFAETMPTLVTAFKVPVHFVESYSADLGRGVFYQLPLDHLSICKPATRQSVIYTTVLEVIQRVSLPSGVLELPYHNHIIERLLHMFWQSINNKIKILLEVVDQTECSERLCWLESVLLNSFTDDFSLHVIND